MSVNRAGFNTRPKRSIAPNSRLRNYVFTMNNPSAEHKQFFKDLEENWETSEMPLRYGIGQLEQGENETPHIQGYIELKSNRTFNSIKEFMPGNPHIEKRRGSAKQASDYCEKEDSRIQGDNEWRFQFGVISQPGKKKDNIKDAIALCDKLAEEDGELQDLEDQYPVQMTLHKNKLIDRFIEKKGRRHLTPGNNVIIFTGKSGSGKTTTAWKQYPNAYKGVWPTGGRWWWPNYKGEEVIIFDEYRGNISYQQCLALFDIHPMSIEYKGGNRENVSTKVIITTIRDPKTWYPGVEDKSELERRIQENAVIYDFKGKYPNFRKKKRKEKFVFDPYDFMQNE